MSWTQHTWVDLTLTFEPSNSFCCMSRPCFCHLTDHGKQLFIGKFLLDFSSMTAHRGWDATVELTCHLRGLPQAPFFKCCSIPMGPGTVRKDSRCSGPFTVSPAPIPVTVSSCYLTKNCLLPNSVFGHNAINKQQKLGSNLLLGLWNFTQTLVALRELSLVGLRGSDVKVNKWLLKQMQW